MGISILEFHIAMQVYGAKRLDNTLGSRFSIIVPCFKVNDIHFEHSGSYYIVQRNSIASDEIMNKAMAALGEEYPGKEHYWYNEIHSVQGILTLAAMLDGKYSKELVASLTNETYQRLVSYPFFQRKLYTPLGYPTTDDWKKLIVLIKELDCIVNPFVRWQHNLKEPLHYLDKIKMYITLGDARSVLTLKTEKITAEFSKSNGNLYYSLFVPLKAKGEDPKGWINIIHYGAPRDGVDFKEEIIYLDYTSKGGFDQQPGDIDLRINLLTKMAWQTYKEDEAKPVTKKQLNTMIKSLQTLVVLAKEEILSQMIKENERN